MSEQLFISIFCGVSVVLFIGGVKETFNLCATSLKNMLFKHIDTHKPVYEYIEVSE